MINYSLVIFFEKEVFGVMQLESPLRFTNQYLDKYAEEYGFDRSKLSGCVVRSIPDVYKDAENDKFKRGLSG